MEQDGRQPVEGGPGSGEGTGAEGTGTGTGTAAGGVSRGQNAVYVMPHTWTSIPQFLEPLVRRVDPDAAELQLLVVASDAQLAAAASAAALRLAAAQPLDVVAATSGRRARRLAKSRAPQVLTGAPDALVDLVRDAAVKLDTVRAVCLAWADDLVAADVLPSLEVLMAELPKNSARTVVTSELSSGVEALIEHYARRARRIVSPVSEADTPLDVDYAAVSDETRLAALRRVLDHLDPETAVVFVRDEMRAAQVNDLLAALGYRGPDAPIRAGLAAPPGTDLVLLFDLPASREELREVAGAAARSVALIQPRQLASLRGLAAGGVVKPLTLSDAAARVRARDARLRAELRAVLAQGNGTIGRELLALEDLLDEYDGLEIAAAAVRLLERERAEHADALARAAAGSAQAPAGGALGARESEGAGGTVTLFVTAGSRDRLRPGDLVGAIANTAGISSTKLGRIDVRESHSTVEVAADVAPLVIERVNGTVIKGRRVVIRESRPARPKAGAGERGGRRELRGRPAPRERGAGTHRGEERGRAAREPAPPAPGTPRIEDHE